MLRLYSKAAHPVAELVNPGFGIAARLEQNIYMCVCDTYVYTRQARTYT